MTKAAHHAVNGLRECCGNVVASVVGGDVHVVHVVRRGRAAVLHELPGAARLPVALAPDDVLHVQLGGVRLHEGGDGVALRTARDHQVGGLAGAVLAGVGAVAADGAEVEHGVDGGAHAGRVGDQAKVAAPGRDALGVRRAGGGGRGAG